MNRIEKHKRASPTKGEARFETFYSAMHSDKDYTGTFDAAKVQSFSFLADLNSFSLYLHRRLAKNQAADILTKTLSERLFAAIGISQILNYVVITQWSSSIILVYIAQNIIPKAWADALLILHSWAMREPR